VASLTSREEHTLRVVENVVLRTTIGPKERLQKAL
jgi:hypothetical protein